MWLFFYTSNFFQLSSVHLNVWIEIEAIQDDQMVRIDRGKPPKFADQYVWKEMWSWSERIEFWFVLPNHIVSNSGHTLDSTFVRIPFISIFFCRFDFDLMYVSRLISYLSSILFWHQDILNNAMAWSWHVETSRYKSNFETDILMLTLLQPRFRWLHQPSNRPPPTRWERSGRRFICFLKTYVTCQENLVWTEQLPDSNQSRNFVDFCPEFLFID